MQEHLNTIAPLVNKCIRHKMKRIAKYDPVTCDMIFIVKPDRKKEIFGTPYGRCFYVSMYECAMAKQERIHRLN